MSDWKPTDKGLEFPREHLLETPEEWKERHQDCEACGSPMFFSEADGETVCSRRGCEANLRIIVLPPPTPTRSVFLIDILSDDPKRSAVVTNIGEDK